MKTSENMKSTSRRTIWVISLLLSMTIFSCKNSSVHIKVMTPAETDRYYSALSAEQGMKAAFLAMFDTAGVKLSANSMPVEGIQAIRQSLAGKNDSTFILTWEPTFEKVAASGELAYTYGIYKITDKLTGVKTGEGTYCTIWQKNADGEWKALLDTGNDGLEKK
jgi:ketosteroid isomerase-like protein